MQYGGQPMMYPAMPPGMQPGMQTGMQPGMQPGMQTQLGFVPQPVQQNFGHDAPIGQMPTPQQAQPQAEPKAAPLDGSGTNGSTPKKQGKHIFDFKDCRYTVKTKNGNKVLLHGINGTINSGEVLAVMGPSGAGKTTLLNLLTFVKAGGEATGDVTLNGVTMTPSMFSKYCAVVTQVDQHWAFLTCRESLEYAADMYLSVSGEEKKRRVDDLLNQMGLMTCADTKCGNQFLQGLSGGQKRRLSLALALIKSPLMLFLDEPTSGLDAAAAASIMAFLKDLAARMDIMIFCTIHQPSSKVFDGFDGTMVLSNGRVAYCGPASEVQAYCQSIGRPMPPNTNPAEYLLDLVNAEFSEPAEVEKVLVAWEQRERIDPIPARRELPEKGRYGTSVPAQILHLFRRHLKLVIRDPTLYLGRAIIFLFCCTFFAVIYFEARDRVNEQVLYRMFLMMWYIGVPSSLGVIAVYAFNTEFFAIKREIKDGMFSPISYLVSNLFLQIPLMILLSVFVLAIGPYVVSKFHGANFVKMMLLLAAALWSFETMGQLFSIVFRNPLLGMLLYLCMWFASFLFAGIMVPEKDVIWPFRAFAYVLPMRWTLSSMATIEFKDVEYDQASLCLCPGADAVEGLGACPPPPDEGMGCTGFVCDEGIPQLNCYGRTGEQVLDSLAQQFQSISSADNVARDIGYLVAISMFWKLCFCGLLWVKTTSMAEPKPSSAAANSRSNAPRPVNGTRSDAVAVDVQQQ